MNQRERNRTLLNMRNGNVRILVATDVAARGLDVRGISHVINFDLPKFAEDYVHRIGRTGRGGSSGIAISFASNRDVQLLKRIERYTEQSIKMHTIEGLEPKYKLRTGPSDRPRGNSAPRRSGSGGYSGGNNAGFGGNRTGGFAGNKTSGGFAGKTGNGFHHSAPDSRHSHAGRSERHMAGHPKEGQGHWHGQANGNSTQGHSGAGINVSHTLGVGGGRGFGGQGRGQSAGQPRSPERSFGNNQNRGGNSAPRRTGDRPSYTLGRGNNGNSR
jgi:superfamily II DNA/RNA helicase